ncbi:MAG TPA: DUF3999 family protein [Pirellulales bacterium]|jgi:hypothetical protein|nr:DUF3999 family protein [Pirellulales bacterium]
MVQPGFNRRQLTSRVCASSFRGAVLATIFLLGVMLGSANAQTAESSPADSETNWRYFAYYQELAIPEDTARAYFDCLVGPAVFDKARIDLGDLRLVDASGREIPYALRVRQPVYTDQVVSATEFNRSDAGGIQEVTLDLGADPPEHNAIEVGLSGTNYRRPADLEGSPDNREWKTLASNKNLVRFQAGAKELEVRRIDYPPSRYRYLRLRVHPDAQVDREAWELGAVSVHRKLEIPGELVSQPTRLGPREPVNAGGNPGSAWILELNGENQPVQRVVPHIRDEQFARDYQIDWAGPVGSDEPFTYVAAGQWRRRAGEQTRPIQAEFPEIRAARIKLMITDFRNPPLDVESVDVLGAAREVVFENEPALKSPLRLYYGNPQATSPHYDLERNLPLNIDPAPQRLTPGEPRDNPDYEPAPLPLTERWPWLVYVVLGVASLSLALVIGSVGRAAIQLSDARAEQKGGDADAVPSTHD